MITPDAYKELKLPDQWIEDFMQIHAEIPWVLDQLIGCETVLELGYGSGLVVNALVQEEYDVTMVDGAAHHVDGAQCIQSMFEDFTPIRKYDAVIASFVLEHVKEPILLLQRIKMWTDKLIVVIGNANSYHRRIAVQMGLIPQIDTLSERDIAVGHYMVYDYPRLQTHLLSAGWLPIGEPKGLMLKTLPNKMMTGFDQQLIKAMCKIHVNAEDAANIGVVCQKF